MSDLEENDDVGKRSDGVWDPVKELEKKHKEKGKPVNFVRWVPANEEFKRLMNMNLTCLEREFNYFRDKLFRVENKLDKIEKMLKTNNLKEKNYDYGKGVDDLSSRYNKNEWDMSK